MSATGRRRRRVRAASTPEERSGRYRASTVSSTAESTQAGFPELSFSPEARRGPTRQPLLAFSSQDLRPGPWPARHRRFRALGSTGLLCGRLLVALVESVLRPGGWESMCRLMCHCVRHISLDNKYGRSVKAIHSSRSRWTACTELCAGTHQEDRRTARRARWGARTVRGAHGGFGSPP